MKRRRGQVFIVSVIGIVVMLFAVSSLLISTSISQLNMPKTEFREGVTQIYFGSRAAVAIGLADVSKRLNQKAKNSLYQNYTTLEELEGSENSGLELVSWWQEDTIRNSPATGLNLSFSQPMFSCNWEDPINRHGYSIARTNVTISLLNFGFEGFRDEIIIEFNATLEELIATDGRETSFKIQFVREKGYPIEQMVRSLISVLFEIYDRSNDSFSFNETDVKVIRHLNNGTYFVCYHSDTNNITGKLDHIRNEILGLPPGSLKSSRTVSAGITQGWHQIVGVRDGNNIMLYVNGTGVDPVEVNGCGSISSNQQLLAAVRDFNGTKRNYFTGTIDEVRLIFEPRTQEWIKANYRNHKHEDFATFGSEVFINETWKYRKKIIINSDYIDSDLYNYPLMIKLSYPSFDYYKAKVDGEDIRFKDASNNTLKYEFENWNFLGNSWLWVKVPYVSSVSDTSLYMYYGNPDALDEQNPGLVWSGYSLVQHLNEGTGYHVDSTSSGNSGTYIGSEQSANGLIDGADGFNGEDEYIYWQDDASLNPGNGDFTLFLWANINQDYGNETLLSKGDLLSTGRYELSIDEEGQVLFEIDDNNDTQTRNYILGLIDEVEAKYDTGNRSSAWQQLLYGLRPKLDPNSQDSLVEEGVDTATILRIIDTTLSQLRPKIRVVARDFRGITVSVYGELDEPMSDAFGPAITYAQAQPTQCDAGENVQLSATADDRYYGGSNVSAVEYFISDTQPHSSEYGTGFAMSPVDGAFDESLEDVNATISGNDLSGGDNFIWIHARDSMENWGSFSQPPVKITVIQNQILHAEIIEMRGRWRWSWGLWFWVEGTVKVVDGEGTPVEDASVHGVWSGDVSGDDWRNTLSDGTCVFKSQEKSGWVTRTYTLTVDSASKTGYVWDGIPDSETIYWP